MQLKPDISSWRPLPPPKGMCVSLPCAEVRAILFLMPQLIISLCLVFHPAFIFGTFSWVVAELVGPYQLGSVCVLVRVFSSNLITVLLNPSQNTNSQQAAEFSPIGTFWSCMSLCTKLCLQKTLLWWPWYAKTSFLQSQWQSWGFVQNFPCRKEMLLIVVSPALLLKRLGFTAPLTLWHPPSKERLELGTTKMKFDYTKLIWLHPPPPILIMQIFICLV